jgi:hypothetical protein
VGAAGQEKPRQQKRWAPARILGIDAQAEDGSGSLSQQAFHQRRLAMPVFRRSVALLAADFP